MHTYTDPMAVQRAATGLETASLLSNVSLLNSAASAGDTTLALATPTTKDLAVLDLITLFDADNSEIVRVLAPATAGATSISVTALQYDHAQYVVLCGDGILGSLADSIVRASAWLENICQQSLYQQDYTAETLRIPSRRGAIAADMSLQFRPRHFPVISDSGLDIATSNSDAVTYDATQIMLDGTRQVVTVPNRFGTITAYQPYPSFSVRQDRLRSLSLFLQISYTAGYATDELPGDIADAAILLTSAVLARRENPTGAFQLQLGDKRIIATSAADLSGEGSLIKTARALLQPYSVEAF